MYHLVEFDFNMPVIVHSSRTLVSLMRFFDSMNIPYDGMSFEIFDSRGQLFGFIFRFSPRFKSQFIKSPQYGTIRAVHITYARVSPKMGKSTRHFLNRYYFVCGYNDILRFAAKDFD